MTTTQPPPMVLRAYNALALDDEPVGRNYSPACLRIVRDLAQTPGASVAQVSWEKENRTRRRLERLEELGLVRPTTTSLRGERWWLTEAGRVFCALIEREGVRT